nr:extracellular calcium-sensing receptor-like [Oncorhynchus nerka]
MGLFYTGSHRRNPFLLPGVRLGYRILDSCSQHPWSLRGALSLVSGGNIRSRPSSDCPVSRVIGDASSTQTIILARTLGPLSVPVISYQASCGCLSDRHEFPNFFRTIPSDVYQALTMARLTWLLGWTWVGAIAVDNDYGRLAIQVFEEEIRGTGVCLAFFETLNRANLVSDVERAADTVQASTARVILVFLWYTDMGALLLELGRRNVTDRQFLASEAWSTSGQLLRNPALFKVAQGVVGVAIRSAPIPGFEAHLRSLNPSRRPGDVLLKELWETVFGGAETLEGIQSPFTDTSQLRITYNVYLAVYAAAHALHSLLSCPQRDSPTWGSSFTCSLPYNISPAELLQHLDQVNFTTPLGEPFYFRGADVPAVYDLVYWQATPQGLLKLVTIGRVDGSNLLINQSAIQWNTGSSTVPVSVCSDSCPPATRVARRKGEPVCCFDCISCAEGEVSNTTGSMQCEHCPLEFWSNSHRTACVLRQLEFLSFNDVMGVTLTTVAVCGAVATVAVFMFFEVIICAVWLSVSPPLPYRDLGVKGSKVILECEVGSVVSFSLVLGYIGLLASLCLLLAFLAKKLPDNFNEDKLINFSMLIFCGVWISFVPDYVSSPGRYLDAVAIFDILASSFGLLLCNFAPKCYIIFLRPERHQETHDISAEDVLLCY